MPRKQHKHFHVIVAVIAVALLVAGWFAYASRRAKLNGLQATLKAKQTELDNLEPELARRPELEAEYSHLQERLAVLEPSLPTYAYVPTLLRQLEHLAQDTGNKIDSIKPQRARANVKQKKPEPGSEVDGDEPGQQAGQKPGEEAPAAEEPVVPYDPLDIDVEIQGTYWTTIKFLEQLQAFPKMLAVNEMSLRPPCAAGTVASPRLNVKIAVKALVIKRGA
jgi:Tfp pilus assembly protein PilO